MKYLISMITICFFFEIHAQFNVDSFEVKLSELTTNTYSKDSTAKSIIIYEEGDSFIHKTSYNLITKVKRKVKILDKNDNNQITVSLLVYNNDKKTRKEVIRHLEAYTYNLENGKIIKTKLKKSDIFEEVYNKNYKLIKFALPNIKNGSVITYSYTKENPFIYKYSPWYFQDEVPVLYSEYRTSIPGNYTYHVKLVGSKKLDFYESKLRRRCLEGSLGAYSDCEDAQYIMRDVPAFKEEDYMTTKDNYISRIEYELKEIRGFDGSVDRITKTWKDTDKELKLDPNIGKQILKVSHAKNVLPASILAEKDILKKAQSIYTHVQDNYTWNKKFNIFSNVSVKNLKKHKTGNVSEINIFLHNLLEYHNIESKIVLLSTRKNGLATKVYPQMSDFNYLIVEVSIDGVSYLLDATDKYIPFGDLPLRCLNQYGRKLDFEKGSHWIDIAAPKTSSVQQKIELSIDSEDLILNGTIQTSYHGQHALTKKRTYFSNTSKFTEITKNTFEDLNITNHDVVCNSKTDPQFKESFDIMFEDLNMIENKIYIDPFLIKHFKSNPFKLKERTYPIDFGYKDSFVSSIQIDLGDYEVETLPKVANYRLPEKGGALIYSANVSNNKLTIFLRLSFNKPIYASEYYTALKEFMDKIIAIQNKTIIVLKKKS